MASYTEEEFAQMIAQLQDSGQGISNIMKTFKVTYKDAAVIQENLRLKEEAQKRSLYSGRDEKRPNSLRADD